MLIRIFVLLLPFLLLTPAYAQQQQQSPMEQSLAAKLMAEMNNSLQCGATVVTLQQQLAAVTKERDELKAKSEQK